MTKIGPARSSKLRNSISILQQLVETLPTKDELEQFDHDLGELVDYLSIVRASLAEVPSQDEFTDAIKTALRLEELLDRAEANPIVAKALGIERPLTRKTRPPIPQVASESTKALMSLLDKLNIDQARQLLLDEAKCSLSEIKEVAQAYGIRSQSRWSRETFASKIVTHLANTRGYKLLSGKLSED